MVKDVSNVSDINSHVSEFALPVVFELEFSGSKPFILIAVAIPKLCQYVTFNLRHALLLNCLLSICSMK